MFCTLYRYMDVKDSQQNCAYRMWGFFMCTIDMMEYQLLVDCLIPLWNGKGLYGTSHRVLDSLIPYSHTCQWTGMGLYGTSHHVLDTV